MDASVQITVERNAELLRRYRRVALYGGGAFIGTAAAIGASPHFPLVSVQYLGIAAGGIALGGLIGYLFFELLIARLIAGPSVSGSREGNGGGWAGSGGGDGGDGD